MTLAALLLLAAAPAPITVTDARFFSESVGPDGVAVYVESDVIAYAPEVSCYRWSLAIAPMPGVRTIRERFTLPAPAEQWGGVDRNPESPTRLSAARDAAVTDMIVPLTRGEITNGWCVTEGDPQGPHVIEVLDGARLLHRFEFTVGEPEEAPSGTSERF